LSVCSELQQWDREPANYRPTRDSNRHGNERSNPVRMYVSHYAHDSNIPIVRAATSNPVGADAMRGEHR
jgi:hypothetical protein